MTDTETPPDPIPEPALPPVLPPEPPAAAVVAPPKPSPKPAKPRRSVWPLLGLLGFIILAAGEGYLWHLYTGLGGQSGQIAALQSQLASVQPETPPASSTQPAPTSVAPADAAMQSELGVKLSALAAQVSAMQTELAADHGTVSLLQANSTDLTALTAQITADHAALANLQSSAADLGKLTAKAALLNQLASAGLALDAGQSLGDIPNAPPALAKFATAPPPTEAALVLSFPAAARAAEAASISGSTKESYWSVVLARLENLITISNGAHVVIGAPAAAVLEQARAMLDAGDLAGAVAAIQTLSETTQAAMGDWLTQAQDLLAARQAIIAMADQK